MTDTTTPAELEIPQATYEALGTTSEKWDSWAHMDEVARAVAAPMVAAELRRIADECYRDAFNVMGNRLSRRADELDPQP